MSGAAATLAGAGAGAAGGAGNVPGPLDWTDIFGDFGAQTNNQTITAITVPILISATNSGTGVLYYLKNGGYAAYTGSFTVVAGDVLAWDVEGDGIHTRSGTITVLNGSTGFSTLDSFTYLVTR